MNNSTIAIAVFAIFVALGIATVVPMLQISYAAKPGQIPPPHRAPAPDCRANNEHHSFQVCTDRD